MVTTVTLIAVVVTLASFAISLPLSVLRLRDTRRAVKRSR